MKRVTIDIPGRAYPIYIGGGLLAGAGELIADACACQRVFVVSDGNVWALYGQTLESSLKQRGIAVFPSVIPAGEQSKSLQTLEILYNDMLRRGLTRGEPVIALGGGVVGDVAGLAAATYMRGVPFVQIPTTLLAQVDSSVGGKVAVNLAGGKNMVGAFYQPKLVLADTALLGTLPDREFASGMAEVVKYAAIAEGGLPALLETSSGRRGVMEQIDEIVRMCCDCKRSFVVADEFDNAGRMTLNFGHTFGHAIEKLGQYRAHTHGEAVAMGMVLAARTGAALGVGGREPERRLTALLRSFDLPVTPPYGLAELVPIMANDKKNAGGEITLVLLKTFGQAVLHRVRVEELLALEGILDENH